MIFISPTLFKKECSICHKFEALINDKRKFINLKLFDLLTCLDKALASFSGNHQHIKFIFFSFLSNILASSVLFVLILAHRLLESTHTTESLSYFWHRISTAIFLASFVDKTGNLFQMVHKRVALSKGVSYVPDDFFNAQLSFQYLTVNFLNPHECFLNLARNTDTGVITLL